MLYMNMKRNSWLKTHFCKLKYFSLDVSFYTEIKISLKLDTEPL